MGRSGPSLIEKLFGTFYSGSPIWTLKWAAFESAGPLHSAVPPLKLNGAMNAAKKPGPALKQIRILFGKMPRMLREIVEDAVRSQPDMKLIDSGDGNDFSTAIEREHADVLIVAEKAVDDPVSYEQLLLEKPRLKVLVVSRDGREAHLLEFRQMPVAEVSPQGLVDAIRAAVGSGMS
jgi:hypothetical protein